MATADISVKMLDAFLDEDGVSFYDIYGASKQYAKIEGSIPVWPRPKSKWSEK